jgi:hypothetical protein
VSCIVRPRRNVTLIEFVHAITTYGGLLILFNVDTINLWTTFAPFAHVSRWTEPLFDPIGLTNAQP